MSKYLVPIGIIIGAILIIVGGYMLLNLQHPAEHEDNYPPEIKHRFIENSSAKAHLPPVVSISAAQLQKNAKPSFKVGKRYKYTFVHQEKCTIVVGPDGTERRRSCSVGSTENENITVVYAERGEGVLGTIGHKTFYLRKGETLKNETRTINKVYEFEVQNIERVNKTNCFVIAAPLGTQIPEENDDFFSELPKRHIYYYYDTETGHLVQQKVEKMSCEYGKCVLNNATQTDEEMLAFGSDEILFSEWMLALDDAFSWKRIINSTSEIYGTNLITTYTVVGREKVGNRECFKVEVVEKEERANKKKFTHREMIKTHIVWVDVNERIMVKRITKLGELTIQTIELVEEN